MENCGAIKFFKLFIKDTGENAMVSDRILFLCTITKAVKKSLNLKSQKVYWSAKSMKHMYDKKPAEEFDFLLRNVVHLVKYPDSIYKNRSGKKGNYVFTKIIQEVMYLCSLETCESNFDEGQDETNFIVTAFRLRVGKESYLDKYRLLWSWKGDLPSS